MSISSSGNRLEGLLSNTLKYAGLQVDASGEGSVDEAVVNAATGVSFQLLNALQAAIYVTDARGRITFYNEAAAALWGCKPELGKSDFCGSWKLYNPDGTPLPYEQSPMAIALREGRAINGGQAVVERADGTRVPFLAYPSPLFDADGAVVGAVNLLVDTTVREQAADLESEQRREAEELSQQQFASVIETSNDAILTKDLNGIIRSWNKGAERLFGYAAAEAIGKSVTLLIPEERQDEEPVILERIRRGERVDHYETVRQRKDGSLVDISLTVSAVRNRDGKIIGASKIARDITERKRIEEQQLLLLREMNHRVKNLFAVSNSVVSLSARWAKTPQELATSVGERLGALARAHALTLKQTYEGAAASAQATSLKELLETIVSPYNCEGDTAGSRIEISGEDITIAGGAVTSLALLLHEFATNAAKYGALTDPHGHISVVCGHSGEQFVVTWSEKGGPVVPRNESEGFGSVLARATVKGQLAGDIVRSWTSEGLVIRLSVARDRLLH